MTQSLFVTQAWLQQHLDDPQVRILDARMLPPGYQGPRESVAEFHAGHLPGAVFFDIEALSDSATPLPHMLTSPAQFARDMGALGVSDAHHCVIYDDGSLFSAPRAWWMLQTSGVRQVSLLAGGLDGWRRACLPLEEGQPAPAPQTFTPRISANRVRSLDDIRRISTDGSAQIVDARPAARFRGEAPEPRPGLLRGHIPGSLNLPWNQLVQDGQLKPLQVLAEQLRQAGIDPGLPIVASCGSGVTAAVAVLALTALGAQDISLYDGSWSEWGARSDTPIADVK
ncbi:3-mercaptopyruvate sulfurtransferase [Candidatus Sodalis sp. SoCistrobi]|uniref:3-mercaptopyruvate sulfurtransferase n=1 Tax=Candidatus Sodalis sp. SoCistrobi TaxID=1922216 RepID=UPI00093F1C18|nr:3-mercaptopyruvate sulfurtransferase [Candidatus Sodalis sp. SoCistrobi]